MNTAAFAVIVPVGIFLCVLLRKQSPAFAAVSGTAFAVCLIAGFADDFKKLRDECVSLLSVSGTQSDSVIIILKVFGIICAGNLCADICRDNSESAAAFAVELGSTVLAVLQAMPLFEAVLSLALSLVK